MARINTVLLKCQNPEAQIRFYCDVLGMQDLGKGRIGYGGVEAALKFMSADKPYAPTSNDCYWKIALSVPNIELACEQLKAQNIEVGDPHQFKDIGYLAHFKDPEGFTIELLDHAFQGERQDQSFDENMLGGGAHLSLLTLRTLTINQARETCLGWGMKPLSVQPVEDYGFTLYFFAFTDETPPSADLQAIENRTWVYRRPYTILEFQHRHDGTELVNSPSDQSGYAGFEMIDPTGKPLVFHLEGGGGL